MGYTYLEKTLANPFTSYGKLSVNDLGYFIIKKENNGGNQ
jgi:hypothetical protein